MAWTRRSFLKACLLPVTGQVTSYRTGDDGDLEVGWPGATRFVDNGDGTVYDRATGLTWVKEPGAIGGAFGTPGAPTAMLWNDAIDNCLGLTYAGHSDWRLPNIIELHSIYNFASSSAPFAYSAFPVHEENAYWSSTTRRTDTSRARYLQFTGAGISSYSTKATTSYPVRPVRGGRLNG